MERIIYYDNDKNISLSLMSFYKHTSFILAIFLLILKDYLKVYFSITFQ